MAWQATDNLRFYLAEAVLPEMILGPFIAAPTPQEGPKSLNLLTVRPEQYRVLETIRRFRKPWFTDSVKEFVDKLVAQTAIHASDEDETTGGRFSIPCWPQFNIPPLNLIRPSDMTRFTPWMDNLPLATVQRAIHLMYGDTNWNVQEEQGRDVDDDIFRHFTWGTTLANGNTKTGLVIAVQPPWILGEKDMVRLSECEVFDGTLCDVDEEGVRSNSRMWAKLWDLCTRKQCYYFVLGTYENWMFGAFSEDMTRGFISHVKSYNARKPTVVESLTYWFASSMGKEDGWEIPRRPPPVTVTTKETRTIVLDPTSTPSSRNRTIVAPAAPRKNLSERMAPLHIPAAPRRLKPTKPASTTLLKRYNTRLSARTERQEAVSAAAQVAIAQSHLGRRKPTTSSGCTTTGLNRPSHARSARTVRVRARSLTPEMIPGSYPHTEVGYARMPTPDHTATSSTASWDSLGSPVLINGTVLGDRGLFAMKTDDLFATDSESTVVPTYVHETSTPLLFEPATSREPPPYTAVQLQRVPLLPERNKIQGWLGVDYPRVMGSPAPSYASLASSLGTSVLDERVTPEPAEGMWVGRRV